MSKLSRILALAMALIMVLSLCACGAQSAPAEEAPAAETPAEAPAAEAPAAEVKDTLVVGYSNFSQKFSPFFAESAYDQDVVTFTQLGTIGYDRASALVLNGIEGETRSYNGTEYFYDGIADTVITENADGTVDYDITIRDDIVFSDGEPMTIDDVIFSMYVLCDPTYDGSSTLYSAPITGMADYRAGMDSLINLVLAAGPDNADFTYWTEEQQTTFWAAFQVAGENFCQSIADYCIANYGSYGAVDFPSAVALWGYEGCEDPASMWAAMLDNYGYDISDNGINCEIADTSISQFINNELGDQAAAFAAGVATGESAPNIAGIVKTGDYSMRVTTDTLDATAILQLSITVAPLHYYGDKAAFDYDNNNFGFTKGDLSSVREHTTTPLGAGPYKFVSYENGQVTFEANELYWKGEPKIKYIVFQEASDADKLTGVATGTFDIADPSISDAVVASIKEYNGGELTGDVITTSLVDNNGYGYMAMCADNVKVGEPGSEASKNLRKGIATVFAVYRETAINSYYGDRAAVIEYPISNTSWAAPQPADEGYKLAYSTDVNGDPIYNESMSETERYDAALAACVEFLKAAGYTWDDAAGKFTAAPGDARMTFEFMIPADGVGDHPAFGIITNAATALATIGIEIQVNDLSNSSTLWDGLDAGTVDMWAAAWGNSIDPDMTQVYHSNSIGASNHYHIADAGLDELILEGRSSTDQAFRKATYKEALEVILDWGVEVPTYQRKNAIIFSTERVNMDTVTPDITTFWQWYNDIELLELK